MKPRARRDGIIVQEVGNEAVVYDTARDRAHRLNAVAAAVWRHCDGSRSAVDLGSTLRAEGLIVDPGLVEVALVDLQQAHLLLADAAPDAALSRRELLTRLQLAAALAPMVVSILAPVPAAAQSLTNPLTPTPPAGGAFTPGTFIFNITGVLQGQTGNCNFSPGFPGTFRTAWDSKGAIQITLTEKATRNYSGTLNTNGAFNCTGANDFNGCHDSGTLTGTISGPLTNPTGVSCTEVNNLTLCCSGQGTYSCTGSR